MKGHGKTIRRDDRPTGRGVKRQADVEVDLHGLRAHIGQTRLADVMRAALASGQHSVRVIHGHGEGVMKAITETWINDHQNSVESYEWENGCILIFLKPNR